MNAVRAESNRLIPIAIGWIWVACYLYNPERVHDLMIGIMCYLVMMTAISFLRIMIRASCDDGKRVDGLQSK